MSSRCLLEFLNLGRLNKTLNDWTGKSHGTRGLSSKRPHTEEASLQDASLKKRPQLQKRPQLRVILFSIYLRARLKAAVYTSRF